MKRGLGVAALATGAYLVHKNKGTIAQSAKNAYEGAENALRRTKYAVLDRKGPSHLMLRPEEERGEAWHYGMVDPRDKEGEAWHYGMEDPRGSVPTMYRA